MTKKKNAIGKANKKRKRFIWEDEIELDGNFAFIAGFTSGGAPFGITHEEWAKIEKLPLR